MLIKRHLLIGFVLLAATAACQAATASPTPPPPLFPAETAVPTLQPDTPTPAPTSTPEPSPTPLPRLFRIEFDASLAGWVILQAGSDAIPDVRTDNSSLILKMDVPYNWVYVLYGAHDYADVRLTTQFVNQGGSPASTGLLCRYSEADGWLEFNVATDGTYSLLRGRWLATGIAEYLPILAAESREIQPSGAPQQIGMTCTGTTVGLYVNETLIRNVDVTNYELTEGKIGVTTASFENVPVTTALDWVEVGEP